MPLLTEIEKIVAQNGSIPDSLRVGSRINPLHIVSLSRFFTLLKLDKEQILLASYSDPNQPKFILTNYHLYLNNNQIAARISVDDIDSNALPNSISPIESKVIEASIAVIKGKKAEQRKTLDDFIDKYKHLLNEEKENHHNEALFFDGKYLEMLQHEAAEAFKICNELNDDPHFIQSLNLIFSKTGEATAGYKAEHILIADLIKAYNQVALSENEKGRFTLAYFFETLQGKDLAKGISIKRLNEMTTNAAFLENIEKIKAAEYILPSKEYQDEYLLPAILDRMQHRLFMKSGNIIYRFASIVAKADDTVSEEEKESLRNILEKTSKPKSKSSDLNVKSIPNDDSLEKVMHELNELIGLEDVKKSVNELINLLKVQKIRTEKGLANIESSLHSVFMGPPGTGKTTIARLIGRIYKHLGYLEKGHLLETDRAGMVAGYVGQTAIRVNDLVNESVGGVLFIDEAYSLSSMDNGRDFGSEAVDALVKRMEDLRHQFVVIVAGYNEPMKMFIESNPGLRSRFNRYFSFDHFLPTQLYQIFELFCTKTDFIVSEDAKDKLLDTFEMLHEKRDEAFGNARVARNLFEICIQKQANRLVAIPELTEELLQTITEQDIPEPKETLEQVYFTSGG